MKKATLVFPGQGSQYIGMGQDLYNNFEEARHVFQEAEEAIKYKLTNLIFNGDEPELTLTINAQPAILTVSMAVFAVLIKQSGHKLDDLAQLAAGHSLGEYTALCAAGALDFADAVRLVRLRGEAMQNAVPAGVGSMAALVGADLEKAEAVAKAAQPDGVCEVANDNGAGQIVLSGESDAINTAIRIAPTYGVRRAVLLAVSAPFHSSLMLPAATIMQKALELTNIRRTSIPVISNVTAAIMHEHDDIIKLLVQQVTGMVRWRQSMELAVDQHSTNYFLELGPGKVLTSLATRMFPEISAVNLLSPQDIEQFLTQII